MSFSFLSHNYELGDRDTAVLSLLLSDFLYHPFFLPSFVSSHSPHSAGAHWFMSIVLILELGDIHKLTTSYLYRTKMEF